MTYKFKANIFIFFFSRTRRKKPDCIYNTNGSSIINCCLTLSVVYREAFFLCNLIFLEESACVLLLLHQHLDMHKLHKFISFISSLARSLALALPCVIKENALIALEYRIFTFFPLVQTCTFKEMNGESKSAMNAI